MGLVYMAGKALAAELNPQPDKRGISEYGPEVAFLVGGLEAADQ